MDDRPYKGFHIQLKPFEGTIDLYHRDYLKQKPLADVLTGGTIVQGVIYRLFGHVPQEILEGTKLWVNNACGLEWADFMTKLLG